MYIFGVNYPSGAFVIWITFKQTGIWRPIDGKYGKEVDYNQEFEVVWF